MGKYFPTIPLLRSPLVAAPNPFAGFGSKREYHGPTFPARSVDYI